MIFKLSIILLVIAVVSNAAYSQSKIYKLLDKTINADIDEKKIKGLNESCAGYYKLNTNFKPCRGKFTVYRFIADFKGFSHRTEKQETFHDLLLLKTDKRNVIIDAFQYTLEWGEMPFTIDLYQLGIPNIKLVDYLDIKNLNLQNVENRNQFLTEKGIVRIKQ